MRGTEFREGLPSSFCRPQAQSQPDAIHLLNHTPPAHLFAPALSKMDRQSAFSVSVFGNRDGPNEDSRSQIQEQLVNFILSFRIDNKFIYRCDAAAFPGPGARALTHDAETSSERMRY